MFAESSSRGGELYDRNRNPDDIGRVPLHLHDGDRYRRNLGGLSMIRRIATIILFVVSVLVAASVRAQIVLPSGGGGSGGGAATSIDAGGATSITNGTNGDVLYDNSGKVGSLSAATTVNGQTCALGSTCTTAIPAEYISGDWGNPIGPTTRATGSASTANTIYCVYGGVQSKVTVKSLGVFLTTGITTDTLQLAIYSESGGTLTLVDNTANIAAGTAQTGTAINGAVGNTTDILQPNILYAFCENSPGAMVMVSYGVAGQSGQGALIGSATQANINNSTGGVVGRSIAGTYTSSSTAAGADWPGTITESGMADVTTAIPPAITFQVN
jgi:hypothetical protein